MTVHHGNTPAAWTGVSIVIVGFAVAGLGLVLESMVMFFIGCALGPIGGIVGYILGRAGLGGTPLHDERKAASAGGQHG